RTGSPARGRGCPPRRPPPECARCSCPFPPGLGPAGLADRGLRPCCFVQRQLDTDARATAAAIVRLDVPAVLLDDLAHDREPEPGAAGLRRHVRIEHLADQLALEPWPVVLDGDLDDV